MLEGGGVIKKSMGGHNFFFQGVSVGVANKKLRIFTLKLHDLTISEKKKLADGSR